MRSHQGSSEKTMRNEAGEKWTPGEWKAETKVPGLGVCVAVLGRTRDDVTHFVRASQLVVDAHVAQNAHLIAAAPALYEALAYVLQDYERSPDAFAHRIKAGRAALALARGESPSLESPEGLETIDG